MIYEIDIRQQEINRLQEENKSLRDALKKIAKPALGGKQQQWIAQQALKDIGGK